MCGRYQLKVKWPEVARLYNLTLRNNVDLPPRYNIAPTQDVPVVRLDPETKQRELAMLRWGLIPFWAKDTKMAFSTINAQAETIATKPAFREAFQRRRCILPASGFYEWQKLDAKARQPYAIVPKDGGIFSFAGLWERWKDRASGNTIQSCTIITTQPNELCAPIHNRMPAILGPGDFARWLGEEATEPAELQALLRPYPADAMTAYKVGLRVGNVKNDDAELLEPLRS
jgi:putative SOS response-associated peptidase YedK